jgi:hypothetical protein
VTCIHKTYGEVCEYISVWLKEKHGEEVTADQIWNASPTGELSHVFDLYWQAQREMGDAECTCNEPNPQIGAMCVACNGFFIGDRWVYEHKAPRMVQA